MPVSPTQPKYLVRSPTADRVPAAAKPVKPRARFVIIAWGREYVDKILSLTLPAAVAPRNLAAVAAHFDLEIAIVTQSRFFARIERHPTFALLARVGRPLLIELDDILYPNMYGYTITLAFNRGMEDLGDEVPNTYFIFCFADFILADGCLDTVVRKIRAGEKLICAPSYRVLEKDCIPILRERHVDGNGVIAIPRRAMAKLILDHRHYTIRAKTLNQQAFNMELFEQFYLYVDRDTLIGRQMPFALVCMKPERGVVDIETFWDYGVLDAYVPLTPVCALGDSDDFCMMEIQTEDAQADLFRTGWVSPKEIALRLWFTTSDHRHLSQFDLTLHAGDLPADIRAHRATLAAAFKEVFVELPMPTTHRNHPFYVGQRHEYDRLRALKTGRMLEMIDTYRAYFSGGGSAARPGKGLLGRVRDFLFGRSPFFKRTHPAWVDYSTAIGALQVAANGQPIKGLLVTTNFGWVGYQAMVTLPGNHIRIAADTLRMDYFNAELLGHQKYDVCFCELEPHHMDDFARIYELISKHVVRGGTIVAFCHDPEATHPECDTDFVRKVCPMHGVYHAVFPGTRTTQLVSRISAYIDRTLSATWPRTALLLKWSLLCAAAVPVFIAGRRWFMRPESFKRRYNPFRTSVCLVIKNI